MSHLREQAGFRLALRLAGMTETGSYRRPSGYSRMRVITLLLRRWSTMPKTRLPLVECQPN